MTQLYGTSVDDLEVVDESVERILAAVTRLELAIQLKLDLFSECLCPDSPCMGGRTPCMKQHPPGTEALPRFLSLSKVFKTLKGRFRPAYRND